MVDRLGTFSKEVTRVAKQVGTDGILGAQAEVKDVSGVWLELTNVVNTMANNLTDQVREIAKVTTAVARGDLEQVINVKAEGEIKELKITINQMVETLRVFSTEVTRIAREVGTEGRLGGIAKIDGVEGVWRDLTDNVCSSLMGLLVMLMTGQFHGDEFDATSTRCGQRYYGCRPRRSFEDNHRQRPRRNRPVETNREQHGCQTQSILK